METEIVAYRTGPVVDSSFPTVDGVPHNLMAVEIENDATAFADQVTKSAAVGQSEVWSARPDNRVPTSHVVVLKSPDVVLYTCVAPHGVFITSSNSLRSAGVFAPGFMAAT